MCHVSEDLETDTSRPALLPPASCLLPSATCHLPSDCDHPESMLPTIEWKDDTVVMIDQRKLPASEIYVTCKTAQEVAKAIKTMVIRGAPAIGVAAAMGIALGMARSKATGTKQFATEFQKLCDLMASTRPTAVNLF